MFILCKGKLFERRRKSAIERNWCHFVIVSINKFFIFYYTCAYAYTNDDDNYHCDVVIEREIRTIPTVPDKRVLLLWLVMHHFRFRFFMLLAYFFFGSKWHLFRAYILAWRPLLKYTVMRQVLMENFMIILKGFLTKIF